MNHIPNQGNYGLQQQQQGNVPKQTLQVVQSEIDREVKHLHGVLEALANSIDTLSIRLGPLIMAVPTNAAGISAAPSRGGCSPLGTQLENAAAIADAQTQRIQTLLETLAI